MWLYVLGWTLVCIGVWCISHYQYKRGWNWTEGQIAEMAAPLVEEQIAKHGCPPAPRGGEEGGR